MSLNEKDLLAIKDLVEFSIEKSEMRMVDKIEQINEATKSEIIAVIHQEVSGISDAHYEANKRVDEHKERITKLETRSGFKPAAS